MLDNFRPHDKEHIALFKKQVAIMKRDNPEEYARSFMGFDDVVEMPTATIDVNEDIKKIALVVGHRFGKRGATNTDGISEYDYWGEYLQQNIDRFADETGYSFRIFYRRDDDGDGYSERMRKLTARINAWGADLAISFHFNAAANKRAEGFEILHTGSAQSLPYAYRLLKLFDENLFGDSRGLKKRARYERGGGFLHKTKMPALLVEPYFGSSKTDTDTFNENIDVFTNTLITFFKKI